MNNERNTIQDSPLTERPVDSIERKELTAIAGALPLRSKIKAGADLKPVHPGPYTCFAVRGPLC